MRIDKIKEYEQEFDKNVRERADAYLMRYEPREIRNLLAQMYAILRAREKNECPPNTKMHDVYAENYEGLNARLDTLERKLKTRFATDASFDVLMHTHFINVVSKEHQDDQEEEMKKRQAEFESASLLIPERPKQLKLTNQPSEAAKSTIATYESFNKAVTSYVRKLVQSKTAVGVCYVNGHGERYPGIRLAEWPSASIFIIKKVLFSIRHGLDSNRKAVAFNVHYSSNPVGIAQSLSTLQSQTENQSKQQLMNATTYEEAVIRAAFFVGFRNLKGIDFDEGHSDLLDDIQTKETVGLDRKEKVYYEGLAQCISGNALCRMFEAAMRLQKDTTNQPFPLKCIFVWIGCCGLNSIGTLTESRDEQDLAAGSLLSDPENETLSHDIGQIMHPNLQGVWIHKELASHLHHFYSQQNSSDCESEANYPCCLPRLCDALIEADLEGVSETFDSQVVVNTIQHLSFD